jgi:signal transduction histidine kinase
MERAFNELVKVHQMTLDYLQEGIAVFGSDGLLKLYNPAFISIWNIPEDTILNNFRMVDFLDATRRILPVLKNWPQYKTRLSGRLMGRKPGVTKIECNNGVVLEGSHIPLPNGSVLLRYTDVSDNFKLEHTLKLRALEMAERVELLAGENRLRSEFLANLSHEIRTPLTTIIGFSELLAENFFGTLNKRQQEYINTICSVSHSLAKLVNDALDLSAIEADLIQHDIESFDLHNNLIGLIGLVKERIHRKKLKLEFDCPIDIGYINADLKQFKQCLLHLLSNAITYSDSGGIITISAKRGLRGVSIHIKDTGIGIPKQDLERVFKAFETGNLDDSIKEGVGLGLTLVRALFELQGGNIKIKSKVNQGTTVSLFLPNIKEVK